MEKNLQNVKNRIDLQQLEAYAKNIFDKFFNAYDTLNKYQKNIFPYEEVWSDAYLDFTPFFAEFNQIKKSNVYKNIPARKEGKCLTKLHLGKPFYSYYYEESEESITSVQFVVEEIDHSILLYYEFGVEKMELFQIYINFYINNIIDYSLSYRQEDGFDKIFIYDKYLYDNDNKKIIKVLRWGDVGDRIFDIVYNNNLLKEIFSSETNRKIQIYPMKSSKR